MTAKARVRQDDVARAIKGVVAAGLQPSRVEIDECGRIIILFGADPLHAATANPWDDVLK